MWKLLKSFISKPLEIFTDGSSKRGLGAWAFVVSKNGKIVYEASGSVKKVGNNRMELQAAIEALRWLPPSSRAVVHSDSRILIDAINLEIPEWKVMGWEKKGARPIINLDLFQELDALNQKHKITWKWIRGHSGIKLNERCDELCRAHYPQATKLNQERKEYYKATNGTVLMSRND